MFNNNIKTFAPNKKISRQLMDVLLLSNYKKVGPDAFDNYPPYFYIYTDKTFSVGKAEKYFWLYDRADYYDASTVINGLKQKNIKYNKIPYCHSEIMKEHEDYFIVKIYKGDL